MEKERVKELNDLSLELGISQQLLRIIVAYSITYTKLYDMFTPQDIVYKIAKESLLRVDVHYVNHIMKQNYGLRPYGRDIVQSVVEDLGYSKTK